MNDEYPLALHQADAARTDFALLEQHLEFLASRIARLPTRGYLCRTLVLATASLWALLAAVLLLLRWADRSEMSIRLTVIGAVLIALGSSPPRIPIPRGDAGIPARLPTAPR